MASRSKKHEEARFRRKVRDDTILVAMEEAVKSGTASGGRGYFSDNPVEKKLKSRRNIVFLSATHMSSISMDFIANYGMMRERTEKGVVTSRNPRGILMIEAHVGSRNMAGRHCAFNYSVPTLDQIVSDEDRTAFADILRSTMSCAVVHAGRAYSSSLRECDRTTNSRELELLLAPNKKVEAAKYVESEGRCFDISTDGICTWLKEASLLIMHNAGQNGLIENPRAALHVQEQTRRLVNSEGAVVLDKLVNYYVSCDVTIIDKNRNDVYLRRYYLTTRLPILNRHEIMALAQGLCNTAQHAYAGRPVVAGHVPLILSPNAMADVIHERFGHIDTSCMRQSHGAMRVEHFGKSVASEALSIDMLARAYVHRNIRVSGVNGRKRILLPGSRAYDAEGVERFRGRQVNRVPLVENGVLVNLVANRQGALQAEMVLKKDITPGNSWIDFFSSVATEYDEDKGREVPSYFIPGPRQPIYDVHWQAGMEQDPFAFFKRHLAKTGQEGGLYIESFLSGETTSEGFARLRPVVGYWISQDTNNMYDDPRTHFEVMLPPLAKDIIAMFGPRRASSIICGDETSGDMATSIICPGGILADALVLPVKPESASSYLRFDKS